MHLKQLLAKHGLTQTDLAHLLGRDKSVITNLFQGKRQLKAQEAALIARHIGVPVAQVMGLAEGRGSGLAEPPALIPFQHEPMQGKKLPNVVKKEGKFFLEVDETAGYSTKAYALEISDEAMNMAGILPGDIIISEMDRPCKSGQVVVAQHYQGRGAKTIVRKYEPPFLMAHSTSTGFAPLNVKQDDVRLVSPLLKLIRIF